MLIDYLRRENARATQVLELFFDNDVIFFYGSLFILFTQKCDFWSYFYFPFVFWILHRI
jgi:hypothetical protein